MAQSFEALMKWGKSVVTDKNKFEWGYVPWEKALYFNIWTTQQLIQRNKLLLFQKNTPLLGRPFLVETLKNKSTNPVFTKQKRVWRSNWFTKKDIFGILKLTALHFTELHVSIPKRIVYQKPETSIWELMKKMKPGVMEKYELKFL